MDEVRALFEREELEILGVTGAEPLPDEEAHYNEWIAGGFHGTMSYLELHAGKKFRPQELLPGCRAIIFTGLNYYQPREALRQGYGLVARYAWGRDYHKVLGRRLQRIAGSLREIFPGERFFSFVDSSPLAERPFAARAGAGFIGRNTLLVRKGYGSWFILGGIATTLDPGAAGHAYAHGGCPPGCSRCIKACPTGALYAPYRIDARKCISYLTVEHRGVIPPEKASSIGGWIFGCDLCQEACPFNRAAEKTYVADFLSPRAGASVSLEEALSIKTDAEFTARFAGSPLMRAKRSGLVRNACICAVNLGSAHRVPLLESLARDTDPVIAKQAAQALKEMR